MVVDLNMKMVHWIPTTEKSLGKNISNLLIKHVIKLHRLPKATVSDQGFNFNSQMLRSLYKQLGIKPNFSTAYHSQTDEQSKRANQEVEQFIRLFTVHKMDNWTLLLPMAEFAFNNTVNASMGTTPFYTNYSYHPTFNTLPTPSNNPDMDKRIGEIQRIQDDIQASMKMAKEKQKKYYDQGRTQAPDYQIGDQVWLSTENIITDRPSHKLLHRRLGPYKIVKKILMMAYQLELPIGTKVHPVFNVTLLSLYKTSTIPNCKQAKIPVAKIIVRNVEVVLLG